VRRPTRHRLLTLLVATSLLATACISRPSKETVYEDGAVEVALRSDIVWLNPVEKEYQHPVTIAPVRLAHILSRLDLRPSGKPLLSFEDEKSRVAAIHTDMLFTIAEGLSKALAQADANQEAVVMAVRETKRWGIFDHDFLTSFVAYVRDERLYLHFSRHDWEIPKRREERLPEPRAGDSGQRFRLIASTAMALVSDRGVAIDWRDPVFARPTRTRVLPSGEVVRSEILMESPGDVDDAGEHGDPLSRLPDDLSPQQLRDLADVEQARREGRITEPEYRSQRRRILTGE
jgi:hypothetical protein